ncbi:hypothetical protein [Salinimicrobium soli]|uniref:hypothetical protein n=1 Tax=Salinimicrobium soli TaxID=1254399 RepID=UPI003AAEFCCB
MKRILPLFLLLFVSIFYSCSVDYDKEPGEKIVGKWTLIDINRSEFYDPDACLQETQISVLKENVIKTTYFDTDSDCTEMNSQGEWEFLEDSLYTMEIFPDYGLLEGNVEFESINIFNFITQINEQVVIFTFERK